MRPPRDLLGAPLAAPPTAKNRRTLEGAGRCHRVRATWEEVLAGKRNGGKPRLFAERIPDRGSAGRRAVGEHAALAAYPHVSDLSGLVEDVATITRADPLQDLGTQGWFQSCRGLSGHCHPPSTPPSSYIAGGGASYEWPVRTPSALVALSGISGLRRRRADEQRAIEPERAVGYRRDRSRAPCRPGGLRP